MKITRADTWTDYLSPWKGLSFSNKATFYWFTHRHWQSSLEFYARHIHPAGFMHLFTVHTAVCVDQFSEISRSNRGIQHRRIGEATSFYFATIRGSILFELFVFGFWSRLNLWASWDHEFCTVLYGFLLA